MIKCDWLFYIDMPSACWLKLKTLQIGKGIPRCLVESFDQEKCAWECASACTVNENQSEKRYDMEKMISAMYVHALETKGWKVESTGQSLTSYRLTYAI